MKTYFVKQKFRLGGERFDIKDDQGRVAYQVEGSFFKIPKTFTIFGEDGREIVISPRSRLVSCLSLQ